jgi:hypothetical protein
VLDSQRTLFGQQDLLVSTQGSSAQSLISLYRAMGGGWQQARGNPLPDSASSETMGEPSDWLKMLQEPLPPPDAGPRLIGAGKDER